MPQSSQRETSLPLPRAATLEDTTLPPEGEVSGGLREWLTDDDGNPLARLPTAPSSRFHPLARVGSRSSARSTASSATVIPSQGVLELSLSEVCAFIDEHSSLQRAQIVATECYSESAGPVLHRFVVLELRRGRRKNVWLRLDRRRGKGVSIARFFSAAGVTDANDCVRPFSTLVSASLLALTVNYQAMLAADKTKLSGTAFLENHQVFSAPPTLRELVRLLRIIGEEIVLYRIWPENCWFFCSLLQQHLEGSHTGWFLNGSVKHQTLAHDIRIRIAARVWQGRRFDAQNTVFAANGSLHPPQSAPIIPLSPVASTVSTPHRSSEIELMLQDVPVVSYNPADLSIPCRWPGFSPEVREAFQVFARSSDPEQSGLPKRAEECLNLSSQLSALKSTTPQDLVERIRPVTDAVATLVRALPKARSHDALDFLREAVRLHCSVQDDLPIAHRVDLLQHLTNIGITFFEANERQQSDVFFSASVRHLRACYAVQPARARLPLQGALNVFAVSADRQWRIREALTLGDEEVKLCRELYARDPVSNTFALAQALKNQGVRLLNNHEEAESLKLLKPAIALWQELLKADPTDKEVRGRIKEGLGWLIQALGDIDREDEYRAAVDELRAFESQIRDSPLT